jgi:hypothetical protein
MKMIEKLSMLEGYKLLSILLENYYSQNEEADSRNRYLLSNLLSEMQILADNITADPAVWGDWEEAFMENVSDSDLQTLNTFQLLKSIITFLEIYHETLNNSSPLIDELIHKLKSLRDEKEVDPYFQELWLKLTVLNL